MKYSEASQAEKDRIHEHYRYRFYQLDGLLVSNAEGAWQYLLAVNGGGAAAVLAFIGSVESLRKQIWPFVVLALFVLGLLFVAWGRAYVFHHMANMLEVWDRQYDRLRADQIDWDSMVQDSRTLVKKGGVVPMRLAYASLVIFVVGLVVFCFFFYQFKI